MKQSRLRVARRQGNLWSRRGQSGTVLIEVLVAALILLIVFTAVVHEVSTLAVTRIRIETRDRAVTYASSLHEQMKAAGCGLDVDAVTYVPPVDLDGDGTLDKSNQFRGSWGRVQGCAFSAQDRAYERYKSTGDEEGSFYWIDGNGTVRVTGEAAGGSTPDEEIDLQAATEFCEEYGDTSTQFLDDGGVDPALGSGTRLCNLGDQQYVYDANTNGEGSSVQFTVSINYWFENSEINMHPGAGPGKCSVVQGGAIAPPAPDLIARRISLTWNDGNGNEREMVMTKRDNVPVDSVEFSTGTRVGRYTMDNVAALGLDPTPGTGDSYPFYVRRESVGERCVWFPFLRVRPANADPQPHFVKEGTSVFGPEDVWGENEVALENKALT